MRKKNKQDYLAHYGTPRKSGRYPWGSGGTNTPEDRRDFSMRIAELRKEGMTDTEIAKAFDMSRNDLLAIKSLAKAEKKAADIATAWKLKDKGVGNMEIGRIMGINESSVRSLLADGASTKIDQLDGISNLLRERVGDKNFVDVGGGVENHLGVSAERLKVAVAKLKAEGYEEHTYKHDQLGTTHQTQFKVLGPPGSTQKEAWMARNELVQIQDFSNDGGKTWFEIQPPLSVKSGRVKVLYAEEGGEAADGTIYVRPGKADLSLGKSRYAQVRVMVDGTHYLKGMAFYKDDLPDGVDLQFNTNKSSTGNKLDAMKPVKRDKDGNVNLENPFGSAVRQLYKEDAKGEIILNSKGKPTPRSAMNLVNEAGQWEEWSRNLSSQMLSKQSPKLAKDQLALTFKDKQKELDEIMSLTNPAVKKKLLEAFAEDADSAAVHLKAKALPRQGTHVILPVNSLKPSEIYAPNYINGERVALIRYPHGGKFEIPELTVNNNHREAKKLIGDKLDAPDAVGINSEVAKRLSGADFDGDTVLVIPNDVNNPKIRTSAALQGLKDFDPQKRYPAVEGTTFKGNKQRLMGDVSNLITDMTIRGANTDDLAAAVRHSMVVIDAEKHNLNYKQSAIDNRIVSLKKKYQGGGNAGASTIISRRKGRASVPERKQGFRVDPDTGEKIYSYTGRTITDSKGNVQPRTTRSTKLAEAKDAHELSSGTRIEKVYADHSNQLKALANTARKDAVHIKPVPRDPSASEVYSTEVRDLNAKLNLALQNRPRERQALVIGQSYVAAQRAANPDMDDAEIKKLKAMALQHGRNITGAEKPDIYIEDNEWAAIQAGAISNNLLSKILTNADLDRVRELATPRTKTVMTSTVTARAKAMIANGQTPGEVARALGIPLSTLRSGLEGG